MKDGKRMRSCDWRSCRTRTRTYSAAKASKSYRESRQSARRTSILDQIRLKKKACKISPDSGQISPEFGRVSPESLLRFAGITV
jgi:hypothetical protein